jgi:hypothetical protein
LPVWSRRVGTAAISPARDEICVDRQNVYAVSDGMLRCFPLTDGTLRWEQHVGRAEARWRVQSFGELLAVFPLGQPNGTGDAALTLCDPDTGHPIQRLPFGSEGGLTSVCCGSETIVVATDKRMIGLGHR